MESIIRKGVEACGDAVGLAAASIDSLLGAPPFATLEPIAPSSPDIDFTVLPRTGGPISCTSLEPGSLEEIGLVTAGIVSAARTDEDASNSVDSVSVVVGGQRVTPSSVQFANIARLVSNGIVQRSVAAAARLRIPLDSLVSNTGDRSVRLLIYRARRVDPDEFVMPSADLSLLVRLAIPARVERIADGPLPNLPIALPAVNDSILARARAASSQGNYRQAAEILAARIGARRIARDDDISASLELALIFEASQQPAMARWYAARAVAQEPCLQLPETAPPVYRDILDRIRPQVTCVAVGARRVITSAWWPGRAQRIANPDSRWAGTVPAIFGGLLAVTSVTMHLAADQAYDDYLNDAVDPQARFFTAQSAHRNANIMGAVTYAFWVGSIAQAVWWDHRRAAHLRAVTNYGGEVPSAVRVTPSDRGLGLSIYFF